MKKINLNRVLLLIALIFIANEVCSQSISDNQTIRAEIDNMFSDLNKSKISSGYLLDYAIDLVEIPAYNGLVLADTNYVDLAIFEDILHSIKSAAVRQLNHIPDIAYWMENFATPVISNNVNIGLALFKYQYIKENALADNKIIYENGKVSDAFQNGQWINPYELENLLAFTPSSNICNVGRVRYNTSSAYFLKNNTIVSIQYDFGDGRGYHTVNGYYEDVIYSEPGDKELKVKVRTYDGELLEAHSIMQVVEATQPTAYAADDPDIIEIVKDGDIAAQISIYYAAGRTRLTKPFIIVEGFDPWQLDDLLDQGAYNDADTMLGFTSYESFKLHYWDKSPFASDYDFVYIDWNNSLADLNDNAALLARIIENNINTKKAVNCDRSVIMGQSMGGLITRIALKSMEEAGIPHGVGTFVNHDSPHLGANVPVGLLYFIHHFNSFLHGYDSPADLTSEINIDTSTALGKLYSILYATSVKQMLINNVDMAGNLDNTVFQSMQDYLSQIGFPEGDEGYPLENLSIVNGRSYNYNQNLYNNKYLKIDGFIRTSVLGQLILSLFPDDIMTKFFGGGNLQYLSTMFKGLGRSRIDIEAEVMPMRHPGSVVSNINFTYTKKRLWHSPINYEIFSAQALGQGLPYDIYPGSKYEILDNPFYYVGADDGNILLDYFIEFGMSNIITFIPTASALAINNNGSPSSSIFQRDYYLDPPTPNVETPFDAYYLYDVASGHINLRNEVFVWLKDQLNMNIVGADCAQDGEQYSIEGYNGPINWHSSNTEIATIDANGKLTVHKGGVVTITAESYIQGVKLNKTKRVVVGIPEYVLSYKYEIGSGYIVTATSGNDDDDAIVDRLVQEGELIYEWGILEGDDSDAEIEWSDSQERTFSFLPQEMSCVTVFLRIKTKNGDVGRDCNYTFNTFLLFDYNYKYVVVNNDNEIFFITEDGYEMGVPSEDFRIQFLNWAFAPTDNVSTELQPKYIKGNICYLKHNVTGDELQGTYMLSRTWEFALFDNTHFLNLLSSMLLTKVYPVLDMNMIILNTEKEPLQLIPFAIVYKPSFPDIVD